MLKQFLFVFFLWMGLGVGAQTYRKPVYPRYYFGWPTDLKPDIVANLGELRNNHWHMGLDVRTNAQVNQRVLAAADGYISFAGIAPLSWGRWLIITHPNGLSTLYGHLNNFRPDLEAYVTQHQYKTESWATRLDIPAGRFPVKKGDFISYSGTTGGSQGPHIHWEVIDTKTDKRLNPSLFSTPIADNVRPTVTRIAMYDRSNSVFDQTPQFFKVISGASGYTVPGGVIGTNFNELGFAIQAYDTRNGSSNQDGVYSARLFLDGEELSSFYIDSIHYDDTRYMNSHIDYRLKYNGGPYVQRLSGLTGDHGGVYYPTGNHRFVELEDTLPHEVKILVSDANNNTTSIDFLIKNNGQSPPPLTQYEWQPNRLNRLFRYDFEAYLPMYALYDKMNTGYSRMPASDPKSVSAKHKLGEEYIPVQDAFEVRIKPDKAISAQNKNRVVIRRNGRKNTVLKAEWKGEWMTAQFREFGIFEALIDDEPPQLNSLGSGEVVNLNKASRIAFTPTDNLGIASFRAEVDGKWLRFTNDKGKTWIYTFDARIAPGEHELKVTVTDIAGNETTRNWRFVRGVPMPTASNPSDTKSNFVEADEAQPAKVPTKSTGTTAVKASAGSKTAGVKTAAKDKTAAKPEQKHSAAAKETTGKKAVSKPAPVKKPASVPDKKAAAKKGGSDKELPKKKPAVVPRKK